MKYVASLTVCIAVGAMVGLSLAQTPPKAAETRPAGPAAQALASMKKVIDDANPTSLAEAEKLIKEQFPKLLAMLTAMEKQFPKAKELTEARLIGMMAAGELARVKKDPVVAAQAEGVGRRILASDAPIDRKVDADFTLARFQLAPVAGDAPKADKAEEIIKGVVSRYQKTKAAAKALKAGIQLARIARNRKLYDSLVAKLVKEHPKDPVAKQIVQSRRRADAPGPQVGKPFEAELTKVDGTKLTLPKDLLGKVVVVDFWATWCGPCVGEIPHMKEVYAKYKDKGVEFVGISLDRPDSKDKLLAFVKANGLGWIQTYSGKYWNDPTARKYGVSGIPSIWVVGKDGKVVTSKARADLEGTLDKALAAKPKPAATTQPAGK